MKKLSKIPVLIMAALFLVSCNQQQLRHQQEEIARLTEEKELLQQHAEEQEENLSNFFESMAQIRDNLSEIKIRQNLISEETRDRDNIGEDLRGQIEADLVAINDLLEDNRRRMTNLSRQISESNIKIEEFDRLVEALGQEVEEGNAEIALLRDNMEMLNIHNEALSSTLAQLESDYNEQVQVLEQKTEQMNTAYYVFGTKKELQENEIIDRKGGLLGIGRTTVVASDFDRDKFSRVDISELEKVYIPGDNPTLLSLHPRESFVLETNGDGSSMIFIEDTEQFWSNTRFLVVSVE